MSNEPGLTLGRLIAAERNALAAIEAAKANNQNQLQLRNRVARLEAEVVNLKSEAQRLRALLPTFALGSGPTKRG